MRAVEAALAGLVVGAGSAGVALPVKCCSKCGLVKGAAEFYADRSKHGLRGDCKLCVKGRQADYAARNRERIKARAAAYYAVKREWCKAKAASYVARNREQVSAWQVAYRAANRDRLQVQTAAYRAANPARVLFNDARKREHVRTFTLADVQALLDATPSCLFTGRPFTSDKLPHQHRAPWKPSLDRIDDTKGYEVGNVRIISTWANIARGTMSDAMFVAKCRVVVEYADTGKRWGVCKHAAVQREKQVRERAREARKRATKSGVECTLDEAWIAKAALKTHCALSGGPLVAWWVRLKGKAAGDRTSLDRIDPAKGYTPDNVQLVRTVYNTVKGALTMAEFIAACRDVVRTASH